MESPGSERREPHTSQEVNGKEYGVSHTPGLGLHPGEQLGEFKQEQPAKMRLSDWSPEMWTKG